MSVRFQPIFTDIFTHNTRTVFDRSAIVRARVRFRFDGGQPVALLDNLHNMNAQLTGGGNYQGVWDLPSGAPYVDNDRSLHKKVGGLKIWRESHQFRIVFYGPRNFLTCKEPPEYDVQVLVQLTSATRYNQDSWKIVGKHHCAFAMLVQSVLPVIMNSLLNKRLQGQMEIDRAVRSKWACIPICITIS